MISWISNNLVSLMFMGFTVAIVFAWLNMRNFRRCVQADNSHLDELQYEIDNFIKSVKMKKEGVQK